MSFPCRTPTQERPTLAYLKIENIGVCPPEGFIVLGISLADTSDNPGIIGEFGSPTSTEWSLSAGSWGAP